MRVLAVHVPQGVAAATVELVVAGLLRLGTTVEVLRHEAATKHQDCEPYTDFLVDVTGCAALFGTPVARGEAVIAQHALELLTSCDCPAYAAVAQGPRLAAMFARLANKPLVVPQEHTVQALAGLPLSLLPMASASVRYFTQLGLSTVADLRRMPSASLAARLQGAAQRAICPAADVMALLRGDDGKPLSAHPLREPLESRFELPDPSNNLEALIFVLKSLNDTLWESMSGLSLRKVSVHLELGSRPRRSVVVESLFVPALSQRSDVLAALRAKLDARPLLDSEHDEVRAITLRFDETLPTALKNLALFSAESKASGSLPRLLSELRASLGEQGVGVLEVGDSWELDARSRLVDCELGPRQRKHIDDARAQLNVLEPLRLVSRAPARKGFEAQRLVLRLHSPAWFEGRESQHDLVSAWHDEQVVLIEKRRESATVVGVFD